MKKLLFLNVSLLLMMCKENLDNVPKGIISGNVSTALIGDKSSFDSLAGVKVILQNTAFQTSTDAKGRYIFVNVPRGTYDLQFVREALDTNYIWGVKHITKDTNVITNVEEIKIYKLTTNHITSARLVPPYDSLNFIFEVKTKYQIKEQDFCLIFSTSTNPNPSDLQYLSLFSTEPYLFGSFEPNTNYILYPKYIFQVYPSKTIYTKLYCSDRNVYHFVNPYSYKKILRNYNRIGSEAIELTIPDTF